MKSFVLVLALAVAARAQTNTAWHSTWAVEANPIVVAAPTLLPIIPSDVETNQMTVFFTPSTSTGVTGYNVLIGTNSFAKNGFNTNGAVATFNVGNVTNPIVTFTNDLPIWIEADAYNSFGDLSPLATNELYWNGLIAIDITNYVHLTASGFVGGIRTTNIPVVTWTNHVGQTPRQFFRAAGFTMSVTGLVSSDFKNWYPTNYPIPAPISNANFNID